MPWWGILLLVSGILHILAIPIVIMVDANRLTYGEAIIVFIIECIMAPLFILEGLVIALIERGHYGK